MFRYYPQSISNFNTIDQHKVIILDPKEKIIHLQAQIDQLNQEKSHLMAQSISELRKQEAKNKALDSKVQRLVRQIDELDKEADDLMVHRVCLLIR